jgi:1,2-diacylglycerol 3-alpha-glucosyltransferase
MQREYFKVNIVLVTNTFTPHVGGVARSVEAFSAEYRQRGHRVLVVAPEFPNTPSDETDVVRIPAIQNFNASDFSVALPLPTGLTSILQAFQPDVFHSQHPFLLGMTAVRMARSLRIPLVFTHHTLYEQYTHYVPGDSLVFKRFIIELATRYANLCDQVFAPSISIQNLLISRGVTAPVLVVPTGVRTAGFACGDGVSMRRRLNIPEHAFVVGHMGRLAPEKNLGFLGVAVTDFLKSHLDAVFLVIGAGPSAELIHKIFESAGVADRLYVAGVLQHEQLADALCAMDVFAFASKTETQGMVLTEAMAAGVPVVALDAAGVREVVRDNYNGRLLHEESRETFSAALAWCYQLPSEQRQQLVAGARAVADEFSLMNTADTALNCYKSLKQTGGSTVEDQRWEQLVRLMGAEWEILKSVSKAGDRALTGGPIAGDPNL